MTSKADYLAALAVLSELVNAQPDDPAPTPTPPPSPFADKTYYPKQPTINILDCAFDPAASEVFVQVALDGPNPTTVFTRLQTQNGVAITTGHFVEALKTQVTFYPGDPLVQTVRIGVNAPCTVGGTFRLCFAGGDFGANRGKNGTITCTPGATTEAIEWRGRAPRTFNPTGTLQYDLDIPNMKWADGGGPGTWNTAFPWGRQQGNGETGLYMDDTLWPGIEPPFSVSDGVLTIHSQAFPDPATRPLYHGMYFGYGAAILTGQTIPETQILFGSYEWEMQSTSRFGSWPALWMVGVGGWPPEIDVYEGFGMRTDFPLASMIATNIHGGPRNKLAFSRGGNHSAADAGFAPTLNTDFHKHAVDIKPDCITWFLDGKEVFQAVNPFLIEKWMPQMNVAVKSSDAYDQGSPDMLIRSFKVWAK